MRESEGEKECVREQRVRDLNGVEAFPECVAFEGFVP